MIMADFDQIQLLWNKQVNTARIPDVSGLQKENKTTKAKMLQQVLFRGVVLSTTGVIIFFFMLKNGFGVKSYLSHVAIAGLGALVFLQGLIELYVAILLSKIDELQTPAEHIYSWENHFQVRSRILMVSGPVYFISFNILMVLFFMEALNDFAVWQRMAFGIAYTAWILYGWFVIRRRTIQKESQRIRLTIENLQKISATLKAQ
jgi:hypothetical protein